MLLLNRGFFSLQSPWTPTSVALGNLVLNTALYAAFHRLGVWGIPLAISIANVAGVAALLVLLRRRLGRIELGKTARSLLSVTLASAALAGVSYVVWSTLDDALGRSFGAQVVSLGAALAAGLLTYLVSARLLGIRELAPLLSSFRGRARRR